MTFSEVREYQYGDDVRSIDWNVTARFGHPFIKVLKKERELTVMILVDVSGSRDFGTKENLKKDIITEVAATLAFSTIQNNDKIGVIFFSDKIENLFLPKRKEGTCCTSSANFWFLSLKAIKPIFSGALRYFTNAYQEKFNGIYHFRFYRG